VTNTHQEKVVILNIYCLANILIEQI
jgi:hypothetical protein